MQRYHIRPHETLRRALGRRRMQRHVVAVDVEQLGRRALLRLAHRHILGRQQPADLAGWVVHVAGDDGVFRANHHAGRLKPDLGAVRAVVALGGRARVGVDVDRVVGAGLQARLAADAERRIEFDDAVGPLVHRRHRADAHAGRVGAVVAARHLEMAADVGIDAGLHVLDPGAVDAQRHLVLRLARGRAGMAADAFAVVDDEAVVHGGRSGVKFYFFRQSRTSGQVEVASCRWQVLRSLGVVRCRRSSTLRKS